jgi:hypothetical protein
MIKKLVLFSFLGICLAGVIFIFWSQEVKYSLPTPKPQKYIYIALKAEVKTPSSIKLPAFIHFYNPNCPCSRFNAAHVKQLIRTHGNSIQFTIIVPSQADTASAKSKFGEGIHYLVDETGKIATACGVYSTPQAVILDANNLLYFRGNYNKSRYCTSQTSNYAELALLSFLNKSPAPIASLEASIAYGCELPDQINSPIELF